MLGGAWASNLSAPAKTLRPASSQQLSPTSKTSEGPIALRFNQRKGDRLHRDLDSHRGTSQQVSTASTSIGWKPKSDIILDACILSHMNGWSSFPLFTYVWAPSVCIVCMPLEKQSDFQSLSFHASKVSATQSHLPQIQPSCSSRSPPFPAEQQWFGDN